MGIIVTIFNHKGGTSKTTTTGSLGHALAREGKKVLVIDNDSQCNLTQMLMKGEPSPSLFDIYSGNPDITVEDCLTWPQFEPNLSCLPNNPDTGILEPDLIKRGFTTGVESSFTILKNSIREYVINNFDFALIDNSPSHGIFTINSLYCSDLAVVPTEAGSKASIIGLNKAVVFIDDLRKGDPENNIHGNPDLKFLKLLITKVDRRTSVSKIITQRLKDTFGDKLMFQTSIGINTSIQRAELHDETIFQYDAKSGGARDYRLLAKEFLKLMKQIQK